MAKCPPPRGVDFFRRVGGMRLPKGRGSNDQYAFGGRARVVENSSDMLRNAS